ncbi:MAG: class I poly(R)-hydroxyalkanoic acid synthase, partial [Microvirga sp.]
MQQAPAKDEAQLPIPNVEALSRNMAALVEEAGKATAAYLRPLEEQRANTGLADKAADYVKTLGQVAEYWLVDPQKAIEAQTRLGSTFLDLWSTTLKRMQGEAAAPVAAPDPKD